MHPPCNPKRTRPCLKPIPLTRRQSDALACRMAGGTVAENVRPCMGESMLDVARACLSRSGQSVRGMSADELLHRATYKTSGFPPMPGRWT